MDQHRHKLCVGYGTGECTKFKPKYVLFHKQARQGGIHIDRRVDSRILPEYCLACTCNMLAADQVKRDPHYVGCLTVHDAKQYAEAVAPSSVYGTLIEDGLAVFTPKRPPENVWFLNRYLFEGKPKQLRQMSQEQPKIPDPSKPQFKSNKEGAGGKRKWINIMGSGQNKVEHRGDIKFRQDVLNMFQCDIERQICPHDHYATIAKRLFISLYSGTSCTTFNHPLRCDKINCLVRYEGLDTRQRLHQDSKHLYFSVIYIEHCSNEGYPFHYFRGSHNLALNETSTMTIPEEIYSKTNNKLMIPLGNLTTIQPKMGQVIAFASTLIHAGGKSSGNDLFSLEARGIDMHSSRKTKMPSDLIYHFELSHSGHPAGVTLSNGYVIGIEDSCELVPGAKDGFEFPQCDITFEDEMKRASKTFIERLFLVGHETRIRQDRAGKRDAAFKYF